MRAAFFGHRTIWAHRNFVTGIAATGVSLLLSLSACGPVADSQRGQVVEIRERQGPAKELFSCSGKTDKSSVRLVMKREGCFKARPDGSGFRARILAAVRFPKDFSQSDAVYQRVTSECKQVAEHAFANSLLRLELAFKPYSDGLVRSTVDDFLPPGTGQPETFDQILELELVGTNGIGIKSSPPESALYPQQDTKLFCEEFTLVVARWLGHPRAPARSTSDKKPGGEAKSEAASSAQPPSTELKPTVADAEDILSPVCKEGSAPSRRTGPAKGTGRSGFVE